jgi:hypothetical protein
MARRRTSSGPSSKRRGARIGLGDEVKDGKVSAKAAAVAKLPKAKSEKAVRRSRTARSTAQKPEEAERPTFAKLHAA